MVTLRDYQKEDLYKIRNEYKKGRRSVLYTLPTGGGKTVVFVAIAQAAAARGKSIIILVHRQELLKQCSAHLRRLGIDHGLIASGYSLSREPVQVASVHTFCRRLDRIKPPDMIIIDEAHHATAGSWRKILNHYDRSFFLGVTATPCRLDGAGLGTQAGGYFESMVQGPKINDLIARQYLAPPVVYAPPKMIDLSKVKKKFGDYEKKSLEHITNKPRIIGDAVNHYCRLCPGAPAIAFCTSVSHAENVSQSFRAAGIASESIDGKLSDAQRAHRISALADGRLKVLTSCDIISEGTDIPVIRAAILMRPTMSEGLYLQQVGRSLRIYPGKKNALILDHVGNVYRHGMPDADRNWTLDGDKKQGKKNKDGEKITFRQCRKCYAVYSISQEKCPQCGAAYVPGEREIEQLEGELEKYERSEAGRIQEEEKKLKKNEERRAETLEDFLKIAEKRGYKKAWAYMRFKARQMKRKKRKNNNNLQTGLKI